MVMNVPVLPTPALVQKDMKDASIKDYPQTIVWNLPFTCSGQSLALNQCICGTYGPVSQTGGQGGHGEGHQSQAMM